MLMSGTPLFMTNYKSIKANIYYISEFLHNFLKFLRSCLEQRNASAEIEKIGRNRVCVFWQNKELENTFKFEF